ncbi:CsbD family protein [Streptomyces sp. NPDC005828]|uniref:CsbD family protein n=1 Tax=Streptomyces sp. NPDC005828 TaxID=3157071 RepID=UPI0033FC7676
MRESGMEKSKGRAKEAMGKMTGDRRMEAEGKADRAKGSAREAMEKVHEAAEKARDAMKRRAS